MFESQSYIKNVTGFFALNLQSETLGCTEVFYHNLTRYYNQILHVFVYNENQISSYSDGKL
jgi:hypothetical protein